MNFYNHLQSLEPYLVSLRKLDTHFSLDLAIPSNWGIPKSTQEIAQIVPFDSGMENFRGISFVCEFDEKNFEKTYTTILKIIKMNKEKEIKNQMFEEAVKNLKDTFDKKDLETLKTLEFKFSDKPVISELVNGTGEAFELVED